jgi:4-amino-4-deoxy-L-arabinose transferase-like glycosyltransferase
MVGLAESRQAQNLLVAGLLFIFVSLGVLSVKGRTLTTDEGKHYLYGMNLLHGAPRRFDDSKMPATALNALPAAVAGLLPAGGLRFWLSKFITARLVTLLFSTLAALLVFHWSRSLYGFIPALFSLGLYIFDPNLIAHSQLVTTDIYAAGTILFAFFCLWRFAHRRTWGYGLLCAAAIGLSQLAKYTAVVVLPLSLLALLIFDAPALVVSWRSRAWSALAGFVGRFALYTFVALLVSVLVINLGFLFNNTFTPFGRYDFRSDLFRNLQSRYPTLGAVPVPTPYAYLEGLDWVIQRERSGEGYGRIYLLGQLRDGRGFDGYYFVASALKLPLATQVVLLAALVVYLADGKRRRNFRANEMFLLLPVAFYGIYFNFFYNAQIGIRYFLVVYPFLYVFTGNLFTGWPAFSPILKAVFLGLMVYLVISVLSYFPYYLTYFNELVWDKTQTYKYLADSNIDWHQNENELAAYLAQHPEAVYDDPQIRSGELVVRINELVGISGNPQEYAWLRENFKPVRTVAYNYLVYDLAPAQIDRLCTTTSFCAP